MNNPTRFPENTTPTAVDTTDYKRLELLNRRSAVFASQCGNRQIAAAYTSLAIFNLRRHEKQQAALLQGPQLNVVV